MFAFCALVGALHGQDVELPRDLPAPLVPTSAREQAARETGTFREVLLGESAVAAGFFSIGEGFLRPALEREGVDGELRRRIRLGLVTALIAQNRGDDALAELEAVEGGRDGPWLIRRAAIDLLRRDLAAVAARLGEIDVASLGEGEAAWHQFLQAMVLDRQGDRQRADLAFETAAAGAASSAERALFRLAQLQGRLETGEATEGLAAQLRRLMEDNAGRRIGHQFALQYAVVLDKLGRRPEAIALLNRQRAQIPAEEADLRDQASLLLGLVAGAASAEGRTAYRELLTRGADPELQRVALLRLAADAPQASGVATGGLRQLLDELLAAPEAHALTEDLLYFRAELAMRSREFEAAEQDVNALLTRFPGTALRRNALALLASSAWQSARYRSAASHVGRLRDELPAGSERAGLSALLGECLYRAGMQTGTPEDFRSAAEAYGAAQGELGGGFLPAANPAGIRIGAVFFQRVMATLRAGEAGAAEALLDDPGATRGVDPESRWQAEWNLVRFFQLQGRGTEAFRRLDALAVSAEAPAGLRLRFLWLGAQLSLDVGRGADTAGRVDRVLAFLGGDEGAAIEAPVRTDVASNAALLAAQARLETGDTAGGIVLLERLRSEYAGSRAALFSFIVQARYLAADNQLVDAQRLLTSLADNHRRSEYAPLALYEAALQAERRGQDAFLNEASQLLERLATEYPQEQYQFPARLKQADLSRRLNRFGAAEQIYLYLENTFPNHPERASVQLSLADTLMAQASTDATKFEGAISRLERLAVLPAADPDLRAEAGFKLAHGWQVRGDAPRASRLYWELHERFLGDAVRAASLGARGRYWLARGLLELGRIEETAERLDNARRVYEAVLAHGLPGEKLARGRLGRFQPGG